jgi:glycosyltransferase involved in cell wall biosynthesis
LLRRAKAYAYAHVYERLARRGVSQASLSLLKGSAVMARYAPYARNAREFHDTSYRTEEMPEDTVIAARLEELRQANRPIRLVYCGRLVARKGIDHSFRIIAAARTLGTDVTLDVIGDGPEQAALAGEARRLGLEKWVRLLGPDRYGPQLLRRLADYDALLFTPLSEDTPRMIFDGYAAALPLIGYDIGYVRERAASDGAAVLLPSGDVAGAAKVLNDLARDRDRLARLGVQARTAGCYHAADNWYRRRADWTRQAVAQETCRSKSFIFGGIKPRRDLVN